MQHTVLSRMADTHLKMVILAVLLASLTVLFSGCSGGGGGGGENTESALPNTQTPETIVASVGPDQTGIVTRDMNNPNPEEIIYLNAADSAGSEYVWSVINSDHSAANYVLTSPRTRATGFYADQPGSYTIQLQVSDGKGDTVTDAKTILLIMDIDGDGVVDNHDLDRDGDGFLNTSDIFPDDRASHYDTNIDGTGNYYENDVDEDGFADIDDDFPTDDFMSQFPEYSETMELNNSNQNDGISVSEDAGTAPLKIFGTLSAEGNIPDLDYFRLTFNVSGRYTIVLVGAHIAMRPALGVMDSTGTPLTTTTANIPFEGGSAALSVLISDAGDYFFSVTDTSGVSDPSWNYTAKFFSDEDLDGVPDDLEQVIESNEFTADSDGDGIPDYVEIQAALLDWTHHKDTDSDGLPGWWDTDSDQDGLSDNLEYYTAAERPDLDPEQLFLINDADSDGLPNFLDLDSDNNGLADEDEAGVNHAQPDNSDTDRIPDFLDVDDDNDGLLDVNEDPGDRLIPLEDSWNADSLELEGGPLMLTTVINKSLDLPDVATADDQMLLMGNNFPTTGDQVVIILKGCNNALNLSPQSVDFEGIHFTWPAGITNGLVQVTLAHAGEVTNGLDIISGNEKSPVLTGYSYNGSQVTFTGLNLDTNLTVYFTGGSISANNTNGSADTFTVWPPYGVISGPAYVSTVNGNSNQLMVEFLRDVPGNIELPTGSTVDVTSLDVAWSTHPDNEINPDILGNFTTQANENGPSIVTALIQEPTLDGSFKYAVFLEALVLENDTAVTLNSQSTALAMVWHTIGVQVTVSGDDFAETRTLLGNLAEVQALGVLLDQKLAVDPYVRNSTDSALIQAANAAIIAGAAAVENAITSGTILPSAAIASAAQSFQALARAAKVTPVETDDISVYEHENSGKVVVENDTELYLSVQIMGKDNTLLKGHITGPMGMLGPQDYWGTANTEIYPQTEKKDAIVQVITPGIDSQFDPMREVDSMNPVYLWITVRTVVERIVFPAIGTVMSWNDLGPGFQPANFTTALITFAVNDGSDVLPAAMDALQAGNVSGAVKSILTILYYDLQKSGPITKSLFNGVGRGMVQAVISKMAAKTAARLAAKLSPIGGLLGVIDILGIVSNVTHVVKTVTDIGSTDNILEFEVDFPLDIEQVIPGKIKADGKNKTFTIKGEGFSPIVETYGLGYWSITRFPEVNFIDANGNEYPIEATQITPDGTSMTVTVPGWWCDKYLEGPLTVALHHPTNEPNAKVEKSPAVQIVDRLELSSIDPSKGGKKVSANLFGAGFSNVISDNEVMVGAKAAALNNASESQLGIIIPDLEPGVYDVKARVRFDGDWSDWSNSVNYAVVESQVKVTVCDNGSAKDDAFTLYVDGMLMGTLYAASGAFCETYSLDLAVGDHTAMLQGVEAPDDVGTYSINFSGVEALTGDATSGGDLVPGVQKHYRFSVSAETTSSTASVLEALPYRPSVVDQEAIMKR